jgi:hypothetical protein
LKVKNCDIETKSMAHFSITGIVAQIRERFPAVPGGLKAARVVPDGAERAVGRTLGGKCVRVAQQYMTYRQEGRLNELLRLVADDVELDSSRDGHFRGKPEVEKYIRRVKPRGTWQRATWNEQERRAEVRGLVTFLRFNVNVLAHFGFNRSGEINRIYVGVKPAAKRKKRGEE